MLLASVARLRGYVRLRTSIGSRVYVRRELAAEVAVNAGAVDEEIAVDVLGDAIATSRQPASCQLPETVAPS